MFPEQPSIDFESLKEWDAALIAAYGREIDFTNYINPNETSFLSKVYSDLKEEKNQIIQLKQEYEETQSPEILEKIDYIRISIMKKKIWLNSKY